MKFWPGYTAQILIEPCAPGMTNVPPAGAMWSSKGINVALERIAKKLKANDVFVAA